MSHSCGRALLLIGVAALLVACERVADGGPPATAVAVLPTAGPQPCQLLPVGDARAVLGPSLTPSSFFSNNPRDTGTCAYQSTDPDRPGQVSLSFLQVGGRDQYAAAQQGASAAGVLLASPPLGDQDFASHPAGEQAVAVLHDDMFLTVRVSEQVPNAPQQAVALARQALARLR